MRDLTITQNPPGTYIIPLIASSYTLACWVSSTIYMFIGKPLGRRRTILLGDGLVIVGGALQASSWSVPQIIIARILCGFGVGLISCAVLTYMSEMSIKHTERGIEAANQSIWLIGGVCLGMHSLFIGVGSLQPYTDTAALQLTGLILVSLRWTTRSPGDFRSRCNLFSPQSPSV